MACIYEVTCTVDLSIWDSWMAWLEPHAQEMLTISGFESVTLGVLEADKDTDAKVNGTVIARYVLSTREDLETYFTEHAARMRGDFKNRGFDGKVAFARRILQITHTLSPVN